jgi:hypothetical protein
MKCSMLLMSLLQRSVLFAVTSRKACKNELHQGEDYRNEDSRVCENKI